MAKLYLLSVILHHQVGYKFTNHLILHDDEPSAQLLCTVCVDIHVSCFIMDDIWIKVSASVHGYTDVVLVCGPLLVCGLGYGPAVVAVKQIEHTVE